MGFAVAFLRWAVTSFAAFATTVGDSGIAKTTIGPRVCIVVNMGGSSADNRDGISNMVGVVRHTWGANASFVSDPGGAAAGGIQPLWHNLVIEEAASESTLCAWFVLVGSVQTYVHLDSISEVVTGLETGPEPPPVLPLAPGLRYASIADQSVLLVSVSAVKRCRANNAGGGQAARVSVTQCLEGEMNNTPQLPYTKLSYGESACLIGAKIMSREECQQALATLGVPSEPIWVGVAYDIPLGCSVREFAGGAGEHMHWNVAESGRGRDDLAPVCRSRMTNRAHHYYHDGVEDILAGVIDSQGYHGVSKRRPGSCLLAALGVRGWVHQRHLKDLVTSINPAGTCGATSLALALALDSPQAPVPVRTSKSGFESVGELESRGVVSSNSSLLRGSVCIFVPLELDDPDQDGLDKLTSMVEAIRDTWAIGNTLFLLPQDIAFASLRKRLELLSGLRLLIVPNPKGAPPMRAVFRTFSMWVHALKDFRQDGTCKWVMKAPLQSYVNVPAIESRLACFDSSEQFFFGVTVAAYTAGLDPFLFPSEKTGTILSVGLFDAASRFAGDCLRAWHSNDALVQSKNFVGDYLFALCLHEYGNITGLNYADINSSFVAFERPAMTMNDFETRPDTVKQCLLVVSYLDSPQAIHRVHERITWSTWHKSTPCVFESQTGKFAIVDLSGKSKPYFDERVRLALYYCKAPEMLALERELGLRLEGIDPRSGLGNLSAPHPSGGIGHREHLCIFVPSSARERRFVVAAEAAWRAWGTDNTFFVTNRPLSKFLDGQTLVFDLDMETDYAHLPVRTFKLFESLGQSGWVNACDWYMKADADSYLNVPLIRERLNCFDPAKLWYLGVPQVAAGSSGSAPIRFASGGAGYIISRGLLPKLATWAPYCLFQLLQHTGGTGMEDVQLALCLMKWGAISVASYLDTELEAATSESRLNETQLGWERTPHEPVEPSLCCILTVHSLSPREVANAATTIAAACSRTAGASSAAQIDCRLDPGRLQRGRDMLLTPEEEGIYAAPAEEWAVYGEAEYQALRACSGARRATY